MPILGDPVHVFTLSRTWIQELQLHDSFSLMEKSRSSNIQEMKFALAQKSSDSFCNTLKLNDNTYAGFQIYKNVPLPESTLTWGENWRRWKNAGGKIPWIQNARYLSCIFQSCKILSPKKYIWNIKLSQNTLWKSLSLNMKDLKICPCQMLQCKILSNYCGNTNYLEWFTTLD